MWATQTLSQTKEKEVWRYRSVVVLAQHAALGLIFSDMKTKLKKSDLTEIDIDAVEIC